MPLRPALLIVYHSHTGGTRQMAEAACAGAQREGSVDVRLLHASQASAQDLLNAQGYLFATPENLAAISGLMKDFFDRSYYGALDQIQGHPYASLICAGSDGRNAARQIERIATGWRLKAVAEPLIICTHAQTPEAFSRPSRLTLPTCSAVRNWASHWQRGWLWEFSEDDATKKKSRQTLNVCGKSLPASYRASASGTQRAL